MGQRFVILFLATTGTLLCAVFGFISWVDPLQTIQAPWSLRFVSDRNSAYVKFVRMQENAAFTELVVGSSTSEVFGPKLFRDHYGKKAFLAGDGGASAALRLLYVIHGAKVSPGLKRIIYVTDLFEFVDLKLDAQVYDQPNMRSILPPEVLELVTPPSGLDRLYELVSEKTLRLAFRTLGDYRKLKKGQYQSQYALDGSTPKTMVQINTNEPLPSRVDRMIRGYQVIFKNLNGLNPSVVRAIEHLFQITKKNGIELVVVLPPWQQRVFDHFMQDVNIRTAYAEWRNFWLVKERKNQGLKVIDFSNSADLSPEVYSDNTNWHDGVHFSARMVRQILDTIYL